MLDLLPNITDIIKKITINIYGEEVYINLLSKLNVVSLKDKNLILSVQTNFLKKYIEENFFSETKQLINNKLSYINSPLKDALLKEFNIDSIEIIIDNSITTTQNEKQNNLLSISQHKNLFNIGTELNNLFTFENFIVGSSNKLAYSVANSIIENKNNNLYNPFFLYSEVGLGKTHLIQAIAWKLKEIYPNKNIVYLSAEKFMYLFVKSLQEKTINEFKEQFRNIEILLIDDIQFIAGKEGTQKEFFYTFNMLLNENKTIIMACNKAPNNLEKIDIQLKSKIKSGIIVDITRPDTLTRYEIAQKKASIYGLKCEDEIFEYISQNINTTCRDIEGAIKRLLIEQQINKTPITLENTKQILKNSLNISNKTITLNIIQEQVSKFYKIDKKDLLSSRRDKKFSFPRQVAFYLSRKLTNKTFMEIASNFNNKNYATIIYACNKLQTEIKTNSILLYQITEIEKIIKNSI